MPRRFDWGRMMTWTVYKGTRHCGHPDCTEPPMSSGLCIAHEDERRAIQSAPRKRDDLGKERDSFHSSKAWKQIRHAHLSVHPLCCGCMPTREVANATEVDHVIPLAVLQAVIGRDYNPRAAPLQSFCGDCHRKKTGLERRGLIWDARGETHVVKKVDEFVADLRGTDLWGLLMGESAFRMG